MTAPTPDARAAQRTTTRALADLLTLDLPTATWTVYDSGQLDGQLLSHRLPLADRQAAIAAWSATLKVDIDEVRHGRTSTPIIAGHLAAEGRYLGVEVRVWVALTGADLDVLDRAAQATPAQATPAQAVAAWNTTTPVGTPVRYWTGIREGEGKRSRTRTAAQVLGGHTAVVWVEGESSCIALTHVAQVTAGQAVAR